MDRKDFKIPKYLQVLLYEHDCMVIPGFGALVATYLPSSINRLQNIISPPRKAIAFNRKLQHNDGLLASNISQAENVGYNQANNIISIEVTQFMQILGSGNPLVFENIGSFQSDDEQNISFEPASNTNYLVDSYGLEDIHVIPLIKPDKYRKDKVFTDRKPVSKRSSKTMKPLIWSLAVAIPVLALLVWLPFQTGLLDSKNINYAALNPFSKSKIQNYSPWEFNDELSADAKIPASTFEEIPQEEFPIRYSFIKNQRVEEDEPGVIIAGRQQLTASSESEQHKEKIRQFELERKKRHTSPNYHIVAGAFRKKANADKKLQRLLKKGFEARIVGKNKKGLYIVSAESFASRKEAKSQLRKLQARLNENAWIYKSSY